MTDTHMIRLSDATHDRLRTYAFQRRLSFGKAIDDLLDMAAAATAAAAIGPVSIDVHFGGDDGADEPLQA